MKYWIKRKNSCLTFLFFLFFLTVLGQNDSCIMDMKLNNSLYQEAWYNIGKGKGSLSFYKKQFKNGLRAHFYSKFIYREKNFELFAYYHRAAHRTYYYFIIETLPDETKYHFLKGFFLDDILKDLNRIMRKTTITERQKIACRLLDFYFQYDEYKWTPIFTRTIEKK